MQTVSVWIQSKSAPFIEMIGGPDLQEFCDFPLVNAPGVTDLSDSRLGYFLWDLQGFHSSEGATHESIGLDLGLLGLCVVNGFSNDALDGEMPTTSDSAFWSDTKHIRPVNEVATAIRRCVGLLEKREPCLMKIVEKLPKGSHGTEELNYREILRELHLLDQHLTWISQNREQAEVSMLWQI